MANNGKIEGVREEALKILRENLEWQKLADIKAKINALPAGYNSNTVGSVIGSLATDLPDEVEKRGSKRNTKFRLKNAPVRVAEGAPQDAKATPKKSTTKGDPSEEEFYEPFATYLRELEKGTVAIPLGDSRPNRKKKWGNPDVLGANKFTGLKNSAALTPAIEFISAEIKKDTTPAVIIQSFGQACAYKAFSHKVYLVIPKDYNKSAGIEARIEALCIRFGIGLIVFVPNTEDPTKTKWEIRVRANKSEPDYLLLDEILGNLSEDQKDLLLSRR